MKKLILILTIILFGLNLNSQTRKLNEKECIKKSHIDFTKEYIYFSIHGLIEIDGHVFKNDTCKCPIIYKANIDGITIIDTCKNIKYKHRACGVKNCPILHLEDMNSMDLKIDTQEYISPENWIQYNRFNGLLYK